MAVRAGFALSLVLGFTAQAPRAASAQSGPIAYVIAPSSSTQYEAHRLLRFCRWNDTSVVRDADVVLVVVRSSGSDPLEPSYDSLKWLQDAASSQLNDSGAQFHIYTYILRQDFNLTFMQSSHRSYDVSTNGALTFLGGGPPSPLPYWVLYPCG